MVSLGLLRESEQSPEEEAERCYTLFVQKWVQNQMHRYLMFVLNNTTIKLVNYEVFQLPNHMLQVLNIIFFSCIQLQQNCKPLSKFVF